MVTVLSVLGASIPTSCSSAVQWGVRVLWAVWTTSAALWILSLWWEKSLWLSGMLFCHLHVKKKKKKVYYKYIKIGFSGANNKSMLIGLAFTALQLLNVPLKTRENSKWIFTKYNTISLKVNTAQRGLPSLSPSCLFYLFIIAKKKQDPRQKRLWTYFIKCKLLFFPSVRLLIPVKLSRHLALPSSTLCGPMSWPMRNGSCILPAWRFKATRKHSAALHQLWILWSYRAPHLQSWAVTG